MNRLSLLFIIFILAPTITRASVSITEIAWMGVSGEGGQFGEWIELYNDGAEQDLAGWKLYSDGGSQPVFTLTSSISASGYLLIERTTASMTDPVPGVNDESGSFGGGGLSNEGEHLVLKDAAGNTVQSLDYASGWPAGDASTKKTMQKSGGSWVTGAATPKAGFSGGGSDVDDSDDADTAANEEGASSKEKPVPVDPKVTINIPSELYQYVEHTFTADVRLEDGLRHRSGRIEWNMGDGTAIEQRELAPVTHRYGYPGTYTVWFAYYKKSTDTEPQLSVTKSIRVNSPVVSLSTIGTQAIELTNQSGKMVDLSKWQIVSEGRYASLPPHTMLAPDASVTIAAATLGFESMRSAALARPGGEVLVASSVPTSAPQSRSPQQSILSAVSEPEAAEPLAIDRSALVTEAPDAAPTRNRTKKIIFGAVALIVVALSVLLERAMAKGE